MGLSYFIEEHGEDFEISRRGETFKTKGLRNTETSTRRKYIGFYPGTDVKPGDLLTGLMSTSRFVVVEVDCSIVNGEVFQVKAYYESEQQHQRPQALPSNSISIGTMMNSAIQQGSPSAAQSSTLTSENWTEVALFADELLDRIKDFRLDQEQQTELRAEAETIKAQLKTKDPKSPIVSTCLKGIMVILEKAAANVAASGTVWAGAKLLHQLKEWFIH